VRNHAGSSWVGLLVVGLRIFKDFIDLPVIVDHVYSFVRFKREAQLLENRVNLARLEASQVAPPLVFQERPLLLAK
jgi:hypothetical protein